MRTFSKLSLTVIALATLAACGGGGGSGPTATASGAQGTASAGSVGVFLAGSATSATYNLDNCRHVETPAGGGNPFTTTGSGNGLLATVSIDSAGAIRFTMPAAGAFLAIDNSFTATTNNSQNFAITRSSNGNLGYEFFAESGSGTVQKNITASYTPASYSPGALGSSNQVGFVDKNNTRTIEVTCLYAADPAITPNFTDYNARIARAITTVNAVGSTSANQTLAAGVATWDNKDSGTASDSAWARLNLSTGQLSSGSAQAGPYTDFNIATALAGTPESSYKETITGSVPLFQISQNSSLNKFQFSVDPTTQLNLVRKVEF